MLTLPRVCFAALALVAAAPFANAQDKNPKKFLEKAGELADGDPLDRTQTKSYSKKHDIELEGGKFYKVDLSSKDFDSYVRVEDGGGKTVAYNDDRSAKDTNSLVVFKAPRTGEYKIVVTSAVEEQTGAYKLLVLEPSRVEMIALNVKAMPSAAANERTKTLEDLVAYLNDRGKSIIPAEAALATQALQTLDKTKSKGLGDWCVKFGKALGAADNAAVKQQSKAFAALGRRLNLLGNTMEIEGKLLDGTDFDWKSYRGKVVLVDFWATWCPPCVAEMPNIAKMYKAYHAKGFDVVGISLDKNAELPAAFMKKREFEWPCIYENARGIASHYAVQGIPFPVLVGKEGKVISVNARGPELGRILAEIYGPIPEPKVEEKKEREE